MIFLSDSFAGTTAETPSFTISHIESWGFIRANPSSGMRREPLVPVSAMAISDCISDSAFGNFTVNLLLPRRCASENRNLPFFSESEIFDGADSLSRLSSGLFSAEP